MTPDLSFAAVRRRSAGIGIVTAIFLLVVLSGLGAALVALSGAQSQGIALDEQGVRAYQAARSGIEWGLFQHTRNGGCGGTQSFALPTTSVLGGFVVTVSCTSVDGPAAIDPLTGAAVTLRVLHMRAEACSVALPDTCASAVRGPDFVQRVIEVQL
jgi:MSHA biogenesis protein MshP